MNFSLFIAQRMSLASGGRRTSPAVKVAVTAVALSVAVMLASIAVVIGFKREIREKVIGFNSHITLYSIPESESGDNLVTSTPSLRKVLDDVPFVTGYSLEASIPAILKTPTDFKGIYLRSLNGQNTTEFIAANITRGKLPDFKSDDARDKIVISDIASRQLGLEPGDHIDTYFISDNVRVRRLTVAAIFNTHFDSYDGVIAYGQLGLIQDLAGVSHTQGTTMQIFTDNFDNIDRYTHALDAELRLATASGQLFRQYRVENARTLGAGYFNWLELLDTNVVVILTLMTIVAVATLVSGMLILILDKKRFIGVARAMGASIGDVRKVFIYLALRVAAIGMVIGNVLMLLFLYCEDRWHFLPLDPDAYYIDFVPVEINWWAVLALNAASFALIYLSLVLPSRFVAGISPAQAMRDE